MRVEVLGPVRITGLARPFRRSASLEMVTYLAFHREGVRQPDCAVALWPDKAVAQSTVHSTTSDARGALGPAPDGQPHLPRHGGLLRLGGSVTSDVERFESLASSDHEAGWREAMGLVRGAPFTGLQLADWAVLDGTQARVERLVTEAALRWAERLVAEERRPVEAEWVLRQALLVSPYDERIYRALLRATEAQGVRAGLRVTMAQLAKLAGAQEHPGPSRGGPVSAACASALHPETTSLFHELLAAGPATG